MQEGGGAAERPSACQDELGASAAEAVWDPPLNEGNVQYLSAILKGGGTPINLSILINLESISCLLILM